MYDQLDGEHRKWLKQEVSRRLRAKINYRSIEKSQRNLDRSLRALGIDIPLIETDSINRRKRREALAKERENG